MKTNLGWLWMLLCCLAPVLVVLVLGLSGRNLGGLVYLVAILACPLSMLFMMRSGRSSRDEGKDKDR